MLVEIKVNKCIGMKRKKGEKLQVNKNAMGKISNIEIQEKKRERITEKRQTKQKRYVTSLAQKEEKGVRKFDEMNIQ